MSDQFQHEDPFEKLFQKKAGEFDIPYNEEDWLKLEKKLDLRDTQRAYRKKLMWLTAASVLIVSLLGYFTFDNYNRLNQINRQLQDELAARETLPPLSSIPDNTAEPAEPSPEANNSTPSSLNESTPVIPYEESVSGQTPGIPGDLETADISTGGDIGYRDFAGLTEHFNSHSFSMDSIQTGFAAVQTAEMPEKREYEFGPAEKTAEPVLAMNAGAPKASLGFVAAPDLSTAGSISNFYEPGYKLGVMFEYHLSPKFSVSAGAVQSHVRYKAPGRAYRPPQNWGNGSTAEEITGICLLIDIPVTFRYNFLNFERSGFYATAGLSSYIMLSEDYQFDYSDNGYGTTSQSWSENTGTAHWLSNAGFSIGYEMQIHPNWSLRAEPFIKVPLQEVGWGNVKLYSVGTFVSINYNIF